MNILEQYTEINDTIKKRSDHIIGLISRYLDSLDANQSSSQVPDFINSYHGFASRIYEHVAYNTIKNPNYNPDLTAEEHRLEENHKLQTGFSNITLRDNVVTVVADEVQDSWDDCNGDPQSWVLNDIPLDMYLNGSDDELKELFFKRYQADIERDNERKFVDRWRGMFGMTISDIKLFLEASEKYANEVGYICHRHQDNIISDIKEIMSGS